MDSKEKINALHLAYALNCIASDDDRVYVLNKILQCKMIKSFDLNELSEAMKNLYPFMSELLKGSK